MMLPVTFWALVMIDVSPVEVASVVHNRESCEVLVSSYIGDTAKCVPVASDDVDKASIEIHRARANKNTSK